MSSMAAKETNQQKMEIWDKLRRHNTQRFVGNTARAVEAFSMIDQLTTIGTPTSTHYRSPDHSSSYKPPVTLTELNSFTITFHVVFFPSHARQTWTILSAQGSLTSPPPQVVSPLTRPDSKIQTPFSSSNYQMTGRSFSLHRDMGGWNRNKGQDGDPAPRHEKRTERRENGRVEGKDPDAPRYCIPQIDSRACGAMGNLHIGSTPCLTPAENTA
ncbi:hypothetical protein BaRGS_00020694 [Batillaria attramentaria]|uniref:Uncharacterized protein n=1 Tax=Batillaria attramentaria TaxID=370345 RepID=A0ABD0KM44_9CAEN